MEGNDSDESESEYSDLYHVSDSGNRRSISLKIFLEGQPVSMELDTGSAVSVMSEGVFHEYLCHVPLKGTPLKLRSDTGVSVKPLGFCCDCAVQGTV